MAFVLREVTATMTGSITGRTLRYQHHEHSTGTGALYVQTASCGFSASAPFGGAISGSSYEDDSQPDGIVVGVTVTAAFGSDSKSDEVHQQNPSHNEYNIEFDSTGSYSMTADVQLCFEDIVQIDLTPPPTGYIFDTPLPTLRRYFWRLKVGGTAVVSVSFGGASALVTATIAQATEFGPPDAMFLSANCNSFGQYDIIHPGNSESGPIATPGYCSISGSYNGASASQTATYTSDEGTVTAGGNSIACQSPGDTGNGTGVSGSLTAAPAKSWTLSGVLRAMSVPYPGTVALDIVGHPGSTTLSASGGGFSDSATQEFWTVSAGTNQIQKENFSQIGVTINQAWAQGDGQPTSDRLVLLKDTPMAGLTISQTASFTLSAGTDTSITGGIRRSWSPVARFGGYRFLTVTATANNADTAGQTVKLYLDGKHWQRDSSGNPLHLAENGSSVTWTIDLCAPTDQTATTDGTDTRWPLSADAADDENNTSLGDGPYWGVNQADHLDITTTVSGTGGISLGTLQLVRMGYSRLSCLAAFNAWYTHRPQTEVADNDGNPTITTHAARSFLIGDTDRRQSLEEMDSLWDQTTGGVSGFVTNTIYQWSLQTMAGFVGAVRNPGWAATLVAPAPPTNPDPNNTPAHNGYYNSDRPANGLLGSGALFTPDGQGSGSWSYGFDRDASGSGATLTWQGGFSLVDFPGNVGDLLGFGTGSTDGATSLVAAKILNGQAWGLTLDDRSTPAIGTLVNVRETSGGSDRGSGTSGGDGAYLTGSPFARGDSFDDVLANNIAVYSRIFHPRKRHRVVLVATNVPMCRLLTGFPFTYFPFTPQFSDQNILPLEEWRRIPAQAGQTGQQEPETHDEDTAGDSSASLTNAS